jgi:hypothetical protein
MVGVETLVILKVGLPALSMKFRTIFVELEMSVMELLCSRG